MLNKSFFSKLSLSVFSLSFFILGFSTIPAHAQTTSQPIFFISWKASGSYIPSFYQGKALPSFGSTVTASLELISNGRIVNISNQDIYWYQNEILIGGGVGAQTITFSPFGEPPNSLTLNVELPQYGGEYLSHSVQIPFVDPVAVIDAPYPNGNFSTNPLALTAIPFFFNTASSSNLSYAWGVDGQTGSNTENPQQAQVTLPQGTQSGSTFAVSLTITNPVGSTAATADENLTYQSQL